MHIFIFCNSVKLFICSKKINHFFNQIRKICESNILSENWTETNCCFTFQNANSLLQFDYKISASQIKTQKLCLPQRNNSLAQGENLAQEKKTWCKMSTNEGMKNLITVINRLHEVFTTTGQTLGLELPQVWDHQDHPLSKGPGKAGFLPRSRVV